MSAETNDFYVPVLPVQLESVVFEPQANSLTSWAEQNPEDAETVGTAMQQDPDVAELISTLASLATNERIWPIVQPQIVNILKQQLMPAVEVVELAEVEAQVTGPSRWSNIREKAVQACVQVDAEIKSEAVICTKPGQSWTRNTMDSVEADVANNPRKRIMFANRPELEIVVTKPSKFDEFLNTNKAISTTMDYVSRKINKPINVVEEKYSKLSDFLDDPKQWHELAVETDAAVANLLIDSFKKLVEYDIKISDAVYRMIESMDIPGNFAKFLEYEDAIIDKAADKVIETVTEFNYQAAYEKVNVKLRPDSPRKKAVLAAGVACGWMLVMGATTDSNEVAESKHHSVSEFVDVSSALGINHE